MTTKFALTFNDYEKVSLWRTRWARHLSSTISSTISNTHTTKRNNKNYLKSARNYVWIGEGKN